MCQSVATTADIIRSYIHKAIAVVYNAFNYVVASFVMYSCRSATHQVDVPVFIMLNNLAIASYQ